MTKKIFYRSNSVINYRRNKKEIIEAVCKLLKVNNNRILLDK